jgi:Mg-chelatase subunit ChlD
MNKTVLGYIVSALLLLMCSSDRASALNDSLRLRIRGVDTTQFPVVTLKVEISRTGNLLTRLTESDFHIEENGVTQRVESLLCPGDSATRFSVAVLLDRSGSMANFPNNKPDPDSTKIKAAKSATSVFFGFLTTRDEACLYSFSSSEQSVFFTANQNFTRDTATLRRAMVPIYANGGTFIWRAMIRTLDSLKSRIGRKMLIVLTDGRSRNEWSYNSRDVITQAVSEKIPVYIIGLGGDVDEATLLDIATSTGGRYYRSPDASTLEQAFRQLADEVITDACLLRYTSTNPCLDGSKRNILAEVRKGAAFSSDMASYTVASNMQLYTIALGNPGDVVSRSSVRIPVFIRETLSMLDPLSYDFVVRFDETALRFAGITTTATISEGGAVAVDSLAPNSRRISLAGHLPFMAGGTLVNLIFDCEGRSAPWPEFVALEAAVLNQRCPTVVKIENISFNVLPCEASYSIGSGGTHVLAPGDLLRLPVAIDPPMDVGTPYRLTLDVRFDSGMLDYAGYDSAGALASSGGIMVTASGGRLIIVLTGMAGASYDALLWLDFKARSPREAAVAAFSLDASDLKTDCLVKVQNLAPTIIVDGVCDRLAVRPPPQTLAVSPNPFRNSAAIRVTIDHDAQVTLDVVDGLGRKVERLLDAGLARGEYDFAFDGSGRTPGLYYAVLAMDGKQVMRRMVLAY